ncbi:MAG: lipid-A-disaccharide synthase [Bacteroidales bacterium]|nr:lipid-A-disaccharide synthase [Bacteroidales bacterium]
MKYYIIAGEASGDLHASNLMRGLLECDPGCEIRFWGGDAMAAVGGTLVRHYRDTAVMGWVAVLGKAGSVLRNLRFCKKDILAWKPDVVILVDYPGFNLRIARFTHRHGLHTVWYIAPKLWAHKSGRVKAMRRYVDELYAIFPFEFAWFREHGMEPRWQGNPLIDSIEQTPIRKLEGGPRIALLPGSRDLELKYLMPRFAALEKMLEADPRTSHYRLTIAGAPSMHIEDYRKYLPEDSRMEILFGHTYDILASSEAALICSGTASLEAALLGVPQVVCYVTSPLVFYIAKYTVLRHGIRFVSLANLSFQRHVFPELLQDDAAPERMFEELVRLLDDKEERERMLEDYAQLRKILGGSGASARIAKDIYENAHI